MRKIIPDGDDPRKIKIDIAHTHAICGFGKDDLASGVVFLACHCAVWGGSRMDDQLEHAYIDFKNWCINNKKTTSIQEFNKQTLKITSFLGLQWQSFCFSLSVVYRYP